MLRVLDRLGPRFAWRASGGASDFAHCSESRQSHKAVSSSCRGRFHARSSTDYPFTSSCSPRPDRQDAVSFRCLAGSTARKGLAPFGVCAFPSARARVSSPAACETTHAAMESTARHRPDALRVRTPALRAVCGSASNPTHIHLPIDKSNTPPTLAFTAMIALTKSIHHENMDGRFGGESRPVVPGGAGSFPRGGSEISGRSQPDFRNWRG